MNPVDIDNRNLEIDALDKFGTMGPTDVAIDLKTYRLKITGKVNRLLSISYDQILKYPSLTEAVLLICPGFFANNGSWTGVNPVRNSSGALNPTGIILKCNPAAQHWGIISNGVNFKVLLQDAQIKKEAKFLDIKGAYGGLAVMSTLLAFYTEMEYLYI